LALKANIIEVTEETLGIPAPIHYIVSDKNGKSIVIEFNDGETIIYDNPLGVITNAPNFDWHMTNLNNYVNLKAGSAENNLLNNEIRLQQLGSGGGMLGLPGDFTPPSRFIRASFFSANSRKTKNGYDTSREVFRILDNFNLPPNSSEGGNNKLNIENNVIGTQWTTAWDSKNLKLYYHTQYNRRTRMLDFSDIDFNTIKHKKIPLDEGRDDIDKVKI